MATKTILLIDNEISVREVAEHSLRDLAGWNVVTADSSSQGLQRASFEPPDVIVVDLLQDKINTFEFLGKLRNNPETQAIPVVLLSAKARWLSSKILQQYQVAGVILKPFDSVTLPMQIAMLLGWDFTPIYNL